MKGWWLEVKFVIIRSEFQTREQETVEIRYLDSEINSE